MHQHAVGPLPAVKGTPVDIVTISALAMSTILPANQAARTGSGSSIPPFTM